MRSTTTMINSRSKTGVRLRLGLGIGLGLVLIAMAFAVGYGIGIGVGAGISAGAGANHTQAPNGKAATVHGNVGDNKAASNTNETNGHIHALAIKALSNGKTSDNTVTPPTNFVWNGGPVVEHIDIFPIFYGDYPYINEVTDLYQQIITSPYLSWREYGM